MNNQLREKIHKAKEGDKNSMVELVNDFNPLITKYSYKLKYEDAKPDLILFFIECINSFPIEKFYFENSEYAILSYINKSITFKYYKLCKINSKNLLEYIDQDQIENSFLSNFDLININLEISDSFKYLTNLQKKIIVLKYYYGYSDSEISVITQTSRQSVNRVKNRALEKLKIYWKIN